MPFITLCDEPMSPRCTQGGVPLIATMSVNLIHAQINYAWDPLVHLDQPTSQPNEPGVRVPRPIDQIQRAPTQDGARALPREPTASACLEPIDPTRANVTPREPTDPVRADRPCVTQPFCGSLSHF
jgi:hypothetical protein